jgi:2-keto-4-pentenoate hydratase/2-oxohepta-3-ene-1,7-dioic acid hydratase in catechol pathway
MRLALFNDWRLGAVDDEGTVADVTAALPWPHDGDPLGAGWWVRLCRDFPGLRARLDDAARAAPRLPLGEVTLRAPVLNPGKIIACASNYAEHVAEMRDRVLPATNGAVERWLLDFDVFLKAPSSVCGPADTVVLPALVAPQPSPAEPEWSERAPQVHHEAELTLVIGTGGSDIPESEAMAHVLGYTIGLDMTVRGSGDRSRRKSYDTFTPLGPWLTTADQAGDPHDIDIELLVGGEPRQRVSTAAMLTRIPRIIAHASRCMRLDPGDVIMTGAPPGVGPVRDGDEIQVSMSGLGSMRLPVRAASAAAVRR